MHDTAELLQEHIYGFDSGPQSFALSPPLALQPPFMQSNFGQHMPLVHMIPKIRPVSDSSSHIKEAVDGFRRVFHQQAAGLLSTGVLPIPPGHPLYTERLTTRVLQAERDRLLQENAELKKRLEDIDGVDGQCSSMELRKQY